MSGILLSVATGTSSHKASSVRVVSRRVCGIDKGIVVVNVQANAWEKAESEVFACAAFWRSDLL